MNTDYRSIDFYAQFSQVPFRTPAPAAADPGVVGERENPTPALGGDTGILDTRLDMLHAVQAWCDFMRQRVETYTDPVDASALYEFAANLEQQFADIATLAGTKLNDLQRRQS